MDGLSQSKPVHQTSKVVRVAKKMMRVILYVT